MLKKRAKPARTRRSDATDGQVIYSVTSFLSGATVRTHSVSYLEKIYNMRL